MSHLIKFTSLFIFCILITYPFLTAGFYADDMCNSLLRGHLQYYHLSFWQNLKDDMVTWFMRGRLFPLSVISSNLFFYLFPNAFYYQIARFCIIWTSIFSFAWLIKIFSQSRMTALFFILLIPLAWSMKPFQESLTTYAIFLPLVMLFCTWSILFFISYHNTKQSCYRDLSLLCYLLAIMTYELGLVTLLLLTAIACIKPYANNFLKRALVPFYLITVIYLLISFKLQSTEIVYDGIKPHLSSAIWATFFNQLMSALPLSFHLFSGAIIPDNLFYPHWKIIYASILFIFSTGGIFYLLQRLQFINKNLLIFLLLSVLLITAPAVLLSLSEKYQKLIKPGVGYIPVFMQHFGVISLLLLALYQLKQFLENNRFKKMILLSCSIVLSMLLVFIMLINFQMIAIMDEAAMSDRIMLNKAFANGFFDELPQNAIIVERMLIWNTVEYFSIHSSKRISRIIDINDIKALKEINLSLAPIYLLDFYHLQHSHSGYVMLARLNNFKINTKYSYLNYTDSFEVKNPKFFIYSEEPKHMAQINKILFKRYQIANNKISAPNDIVKFVTNKAICCLRNSPL